MNQGFRQANHRQFCGGGTGEKGGPAGRSGGGGGGARPHTCNTALLRGSTANVKLYVPVRGVCNDSVENTARPSDVTAAVPLRAGESERAGPDTVTSRASSSKAPTYGQTGAWEPVREPGTPPDFFAKHPIPGAVACAPCGPRKLSLFEQEIVQLAPRGKFFTE